MSSRTFINTVAASVAAPIVCLIVSAIAGGLFALIQTLFTVLRPGIIGFFAVIVGTCIGVIAARTTCDKFLTPYQTGVVFVVFAVLVLAGLTLMLLYRPLTVDQINSYVQLMVLALMAYVIFWRQAEI
jgi:hypothetical protein